MVDNSKIVNLKDNNLGTLDTGASVLNVQAKSAFMTLGKFYDVPKNQRILIAGVDGMVSAGVPEGGVKPVGGVAAPFNLYSDKFAGIVIQSEEVAKNISRITDIIWNEFPTKHAEQFDRYIAGIDQIPADVEIVNLGTTTNVQTIGTGSDAQLDFDTAGENIDEVNGIALSSSMLSYLKRQRIAQTGQRAFDVEGDAKTGLIDGIPYATFKSSTKVGYLGNYDKFAYTLHSDMVNRVWDQATLVDEKNNITYHLAQKNLAGFVSEVWQGAAVKNVNDFVKITPAETTGE